MSTTVIVKAQLQRKHDVELRRFAAPATYEELRTIVAHLWGSDSARLVIEYVDDDDDRVRMSSEPEWGECLRLHRSQSQLLLPISTGASMATSAAGGRPSLQLFISRQSRKGAAAKGSSSDDEAAATPSVVNDVPRGEQLPRAAAATAPNAVAVAHVDPEDEPESRKKMRVLDAVVAIPASSPAVATPAPTPTPAVAAPVVAVVPPAPLATSPRGLRIIGMHTESDLHEFLALLNTVYALTSAEVALLSGDRAVSKIVEHVSTSDDGKIKTVRVSRSMLRSDVADEVQRRVNNHDSIRGETLLDRALRVFPNEGAFHYQLALCIATNDAENHRRDDILTSLEAATTFGFDEFNFVLTAPQLARFQPAKKEPRFDEVVRRMKDAKAERLVVSMIALLPHLTVEEARDYLKRTKGNLDAAVGLALGGQ